SMWRRPQPRATRFPYTTLFRSENVASTATLIVSISTAGTVSIFTTAVVSTDWGAISTGFFEERAVEQAIKLLSIPKPTQNHSKRILFYIYIGKETSTPRASAWLNWTLALVSPSLIQSLS